MNRRVCITVLAWLVSAQAAAAEAPKAVESIDGGAPAQPLPEPAQAVHDIFAAHDFEFCHEPKYPLTPAEKAWCELGAGDNTRACPKLREACKNDAQATQLELREPTSFRLPDLGLPLRLVLWILLGIGLALLVFALVRHFLDHTPKTDVVRTASPGAVDEARAAALARQVETDVQRLLERARAAAASGDFRAAIGDAYAALLRRLEGAGVVRVEPDQTNGDYVRKVTAERPAIARQVAEVVDAVESAQFGDRAVTREGFDGVWTRVTGLFAGHMGLLIVFACLLVGSACGQPREGWDHSPSGRAGVVAYLGKRGFKVHERLVSISKIADSTADQLILLPGAHLGDEEWRAIKTWMVSGNHTLVIAGGKRELPGWIGAAIAEEPSVSSAIITTRGEAKKTWGPLRVQVPGGNRLRFKKGDKVALARGDDAYAVETKPNCDDKASGRIVVLADDFLFRNASLLVADNAMALESLLRDGGTSLDLAGDLTGMVSSNPVESVRRGRLGPVMVQLAAFLLVFFVCKGARFGRPIHSQRIVRREFTEHVRALGLHYARARGERLALTFMGAYASERLRERCGLRVDRSLSGLADAVATRTGRPVGTVMRILLEARDAGKGVPAEPGAQELATVGDLCKLLEQTGGTGGHKAIPGDI